MPYVAYGYKALWYRLILSTRSGRRALSGATETETPALVEIRRRSAYFDRNYMNRIVKLDLKHIPRGEKGSLQNFLRFSYNAVRRKHLTLGKTKHETLKEIIKKIKKPIQISFQITTETTSRYNSCARAKSF